jgi:hypothetical protein
LKKQWSTHEQYKKRSEIRKTVKMEPLRPTVPQVETAGYDENPTRRSVELERRKALIQSAQNTPSGTPTSARRKVFRGAHARTLSLVSPAKSEAGFSVHEDQSAGGLKSPDLEVASSSRSFSPALSKRASWQPRSYNNGGSSGVKQIAEDFKLGLWSFVEDIRQATVGDEPINGHPARASSAESQPSRRASTRTRGGDGEDTIRAPAPSRPRLNTAFDAPHTSETPAAQRAAAANVLQERGNVKTGGAGTKSKHFSWTPLTFDSFDDNDWSNWESPLASAGKSPRWSGSTVNGGEAIAPIAEKADEMETPL